MKRILTILAVPVLAGAQVASVDITTPTLGYLYDTQTRGLRAIEGVPGAAAIGNPIALGVDLERASLSPDRRLALGVASGETYLVNLDGTVGAARRTALPAGEFYFSPAGTTLAIALENSVQVWDLQSAARRRELPAGESKWDRIAVSDDGLALVALSGTSLYRLTADGPAMIAEGITAMEFLRSTQDLLIADSASQRLALLAKADPEAQSPISDGLAGVHSIVLSRDEQQLAALTSDALLLVDLKSGETRRLPLETPAGNLRRASGNAVFQLNAESDSWLADFDAETPRLLALSRGNQ